MNYWSKIREPVVSAFIIFNVFSLALILIPGFPGKDIFLKPIFIQTQSANQSNAGQNAKMRWWPPFLPYLMATGLFQGKGVFVPRPHVYEVKLSAEVFFTDNTRVVWNNLNMQSLDLFDRYRKERFRRWGRINVDTNSPLRWWPETARWIARQYYHAEKVPTLVVLWRDRIDTPAPDGKAVPTTVHEAIYEYKVTAKDLQDSSTDEPSAGVKK